MSKRPADASDAAQSQTAASSPEQPDYKSDATTNEDQTLIEARLAELKEILRILVTDNGDAKQILQNLIADYEYALKLVQSKKTELVLTANSHVKTRWKQVLEYKSYKLVLDALRVNPICNNGTQQLQLLLKLSDLYNALHTVLVTHFKSKIPTHIEPTTPTAFNKLLSENFSVWNISNLTKGHKLALIVLHAKQDEKSQQNFSDLCNYIFQLEIFVGPSVPVKAMCSFLLQTDSEHQSLGHLIAGIERRNINSDQITQLYLILLINLINKHNANINDIFNIINQIPPSKKFDRNMGYYITHYRNEDVIKVYLDLLILLRAKGLPKNLIKAHLLHDGDDSSVTNISCLSGALIYYFIDNGFAADEEILKQLKSNDDAKEAVFKHLQSMTDHTVAIKGLQNALNVEHPLGKFFLKKFIGIDEQISEKLQTQLKWRQAQIETGVITQGTAGAGGDNKRKMKIHDKKELPLTLMLLRPQDAAINTANDELSHATDPNLAL